MQNLFKIQNPPGKSVTQLKTLSNNPNEAFCENSYRLKAFNHFYYFYYFFKGPKYVAANRSNSFVSFNPVFSFQDEVCLLDKILKPKLIIIITNYCHSFATQLAQNDYLFKFVLLQQGGKPNINKLCFYHILITLLSFQKLYKNLKPKS